MIRTIVAKARAVAVWLEVTRHRRQLYKSARVLVPVLVAAGVLTNGDASKVLAVAGAVLGFGGFHLAARHTK